MENTTAFDNTLIISTIKKLLKRMGISLNLIGYVYIVDALTRMINSQEIFFLNEIYAKISEFHKTTSTCVEAAIRNAITKCSKYNESNFRNILGVSKTVHISNSVFLSISKEIVLDTLIEEYKNNSSYK